MTGDLDIVINILDGPSVVYENRTSGTDTTKGYLRINFRGPEGNRNGFGAKVWIWQNGKMQSNMFNPCRGYLSAMEYGLHFGINNAGVDSLKVLWPDGKEQMLKTVKPNQLLSLENTNAVKVEAK
jgi:hypothetical protein